jgi:3-hydroxy-9,10-secoandrosta-1,3,5(10)-triene-9,17-dione monooxygenase reductase component
MGHFATGVTIVTTKHGEGLYGMTVNAFTSVSLQPCLVLICLANDARTTPAVQARGWFAVNILGADQRELSNRFALLENDRFADTEYSMNSYDLPVLAGCIAHLICRVFRIDPGGDHVIVLGEVVEAEVHEESPLLFFRGSYAALAQ